MPESMADATDGGTLEQRVVDLITKFTKLPPGQVTMDSTFVDLSLDSLDGMELVFEFEEAFDLTIPDDVVAGMTDVRQIVEALRRIKSTPTPPSPAAAR